MSETATELVSFFGKPIEELSRDELVTALRMMAFEYRHCRKEFDRVRPYVDYAEMLRNNK